MPSRTPGERHPDRTPATFRTTSWTRVIQAGIDGAEGRLALAELCQAYWYPLYAFARRRGSGPQDAEDSVQSFLAWLIESELVLRADPQRGRFRSFLVSAFQQFLNRQFQHQSAAKRHPDNPIVSIDASDGARLYDRETAEKYTPERQFERAWAMALIDRSLVRLREEHAAKGKLELYDAIKGHLTGEQMPHGPDAARLLGRSEGAIRVAVHRLKQRFAELLRNEVGQTVESADEVDQELQYLLAVLKT